MIKKYLAFSILILSLLSASCSNDGHDYSNYDADTARSPYIPKKDVRLVKSVRTTNNFGGRDYSWEHTFKYDVHNRIKSINVTSSVHMYSEVNSRYYLCNITSKADYYYFDKAIDIRYEVEYKYPEVPLENSRNSGIAKGLFSSNGVMRKFSSLDLEYSGMMLVRAYADGGRRYEISRDRSGNVTGYKRIKDYDDTIISDKEDYYNYSSIKNKTNFDFSGYFGYWGIESEIPYIDRTYDAVYQLAAFGMLGSTSPNLPIGKVFETENGSVFGKWTFDDKGYPIEFTDSDGRKTVVTYVE